MKNIPSIENDFHNFGASAAERINQLTAAIEAAPGETMELITAAIKTETDSAVRNWLIRFRETLESLALEVAADV